MAGPLEHRCLNTVRQRLLPVTSGLAAIGGADGDAVLECGAAVTERPERTAQGYRRFRCRQCGKQLNERSGTLLNRAQYLSDVISLVALWRLR